MFNGNTGALVDSEPDNLDWINAVQFADCASSYLEAIVGGYDPYITVRAYEITS